MVSKYPRLQSVRWSGLRIERNALKEHQRRHAANHDRAEEQVGQTREESVGQIARGQELAPTEKPRSVDHVGPTLLDGPGERGQVLGIVLQVRVLDDDHVARTVVEAGAYRAPFSRVLTVEKYLEAGILKRRKDLTGAVLGPVVDDDDLLAIAGHFDVELDLSELRSRATGSRRIRHELDEWTMPDGRRILVVAEGRLVNLGAAEGHPAEVMDMSFGNQALAAEWLVVNGDELDNQVHRLPEHLDGEVAAIALEHLGGGLEVLTPEQQHYLASWQEGT